MAQLNPSNPYVGPRSFTASEGPLLFGRDREAEELITLIISERAVLFYAPPGAGKSSLINAKIGPGLEAEGFEVLPTGRVSSQDSNEAGANNIFIYNLIRSLDQKDSGRGRFEKMSLPDFLNNLVLDNGLFGFDDRYIYSEDTILKPRVLIIDQFEEIFSTNLTFWEQREEFFRQLGEALAQDQKLWLLLAMVEDSIAGIDPYTFYLPDHLRHRYYMQKPDRQTALEMAGKPALLAGRPFVPGAAEILVDNLLRFQTGGQGEFKGEFVERVLLQLICYMLWEDLSERPGDNITVEDVEAYADVDIIFNEFYDNALAKTAAETGINEINLRDWIETKLITEAKQTTGVFRDEQQTSGLPTTAVDLLQRNSRFIFETTARQGELWVELASTGFVQPILNANFLWRQRHPLTHMAAEWQRDGRPQAKLLQGDALAQLLDTNWAAFGPTVEEFLKASHEAQQRRQKIQIEQMNEQIKAMKAENIKLQRRLMIAVVSAALLFLLCLGIWFLN